VAAGFEPARQLPVYTFSRRAPSSARAGHRRRVSRCSEPERPPLPRRPTTRGLGWTMCEPPPSPSGPSESSGLPREVDGLRRRLAAAVSPFSRAVHRAVSRRSPARSVSNGRISTRQHETCTSPRSSRPHGMQTSAFLAPESRCKEAKSALGQRPPWTSGSLGPSADRSRERSTDRLRGRLRGLPLARRVSLSLALVDVVEPRRSTRDTCANTASAARIMSGLRGQTR
jgi:hypothetical protein